MDTPTLRAQVAVKENSDTQIRPKNQTISKMKIWIQIFLDPNQGCSQLAPKGISPPWAEPSARGAGDEQSLGCSAPPEHISAPTATAPAAPQSLRAPGRLLQPSRSLIVTLICPSQTPGGDSSVNSFRRCSIFPAWPKVTAQVVAVSHQC